MYTENDNLKIKEVEKLMAMNPDELERLMMKNEAEEMKKINK